MYRPHFLRICGNVLICLCLFAAYYLGSGDKLILHDNSATNKVEHLIVRIYGALILGQVRTCGIAANSTRILASVTLNPRSGRLTRALSFLYSFGLSGRRAPLRMRTHGERWFRPMPSCLH